MPLTTVYTQLNKRIRATIKLNRMKNYIDSQEHWEDSINADYDKKEQMQKEMEKEINKQIEMQIRGQELPIHNVSDCLDEDANNCGCEPETCKMLKGKCKNLAYR